MNTSHFWFRSGNYSLLGRLDSAGPKRAPVGVIIVPPFGWEEVCSYRPLRFMARSFAAMGIPAMRYDLPGTGDSSGDARDAELLEAWIQSVADAAAELRSSTGVENVAAVGIHFGALLAAAAASRGADLQQLALWGAAAKGRTIVRELRASANMESWEYSAKEDTPPQPIPGLETGGFLLVPETLHALETLDLSKASWPKDLRVLLLSRDDLPHDANLTAGLRESGVTVEAAKGSGYGDMMATEEAVFPKETSRLIARFVTAGAREAAMQDAAKYPRIRSTATDSFCDRQNATDGRGRNKSVESIFKIETSTLGMFGILAQPGPAVPRSDDCLIYLNPGGVRHTGPNRMWVESARRWAARGVGSLRLDVQGIGESEGKEYLDIPALYEQRLLEQIDIAIDSLRWRAGFKRFVAIGLCSGACWGFHAAMRNADVRAAILINPSLLYWDAGADRRRILRQMASGFAGWADYARMVRVGIERGDIQRGARRIAERLGRTRTKGNAHLKLGFDSLAAAWSAFEQNKKQVTLVFREGEPLLAELETSGQLPPAENSFVRCLRVPNAGHTFRPVWAQKLVHDLLDTEIASVMQPPLAASVTDRTDDLGFSPEALHA